MCSMGERTHSPPVSEEVQYLLLKSLSGQPGASQRQLARVVGVSVGKLNYCLRSLIAKGLVKARNFKNSENKSAYAYVLTPRGIEEKWKTTQAFLLRKVAEYQVLRAEIERLSAEVESYTKRADDAEEGCRLD